MNKSRVIKIVYKEKSYFINIYSAIEIMKKLKEKALKNSELQNIEIKYSNEKEFKNLLKKFGLFDIDFFEVMEKCY